MVKVQQGLHKGVGVINSTPSPKTSILAGSYDSRGYIDGIGEEVRFANLFSMRMDHSGNLFFMDYYWHSGNFNLRKMNSFGEVSTLVKGDKTLGVVNGPLKTALLNAPSNIAIDHLGNIYVSESAQRIIQKISPSGIVSTFAGMANVSDSIDGQDTDARFLYPKDMECDRAGNLYVIDSDNSIRKITPAGMVTTLDIYDPTTGKKAALDYLEGIAIDSNDNIYITSRGTLILKITPDGDLITLAGSLYTEESIDGTGQGASFTEIRGIAINDSDEIYINDNNSLRKVSVTGVVKTIVGGDGMLISKQPIYNTRLYGYFSNFTFDNSGNLVIFDELSVIKKIDKSLL